MRIISNIFAVAASVIMIVSCTSVQEQRTDKALGAIMSEFQAVGIAVAVVKDGKIVYNKSFGYKDLENRTPLAKDDVMRIASVSKSFTGTALMQLVDSGTIYLDDDVSDLIGFKIRNPHHLEIPITLRMILSHTSSITDKEDYSTLDHLNPAVYGDCAESYCTYAPGEEFNYSDMGVNLAGAILEKVSGIRFDNYISENIIKPLGLYGGHNVDSLDAGKFAKIYTKADSGYVASEDAYRSMAEYMPGYVMGYSAPIFSPSGGVKISAQDLAKYMMMHMNYGELDGIRIISRESAKAMQTLVPLKKSVPADSAASAGSAVTSGSVATSSTTVGEDIENTYCLCLGEQPNMIDDPKYNVPGNYPIGHNGGAYGLNSIMIWSPSDGWGIVAMTNGYTRIEGKNFLKSITNAIYSTCIKEE